MDKRLLSIVIVAVGIIAGAVLVSDQQNINEQASEIRDAGKVVLEPIMKDTQNGYIDRLSIGFSSGTNDEEPIMISSVSIRLKYPGDIRGKIKNVGNEPFKRGQFPDQNWELVVNRVEYLEGVTELDMAAIHTGIDGYAVPGTEELAYLEFINNEFSKDDYAVMGWDEEHAKMMTKQVPVQDILKTVEKR